MKLVAGARIEKNHPVALGADGKAYPACDLHVDVVEVAHHRAQVRSLFLAWTPVEEALPDEGAYVFVYDDTTEWAYIAALDGEGEWGSTDGEPLLGVTHWMPMPEVPE